MKTLKLSIIAGISASTVLMGASAQALTATLSPYGNQSSSVSGALTETFDAQTLGDFSGAIAIGTLSSGGAITSGTYGPNSGDYGGANGTDYYAVGTQSGASAATLTLSTAASYFGFYWMAGDNNGIPVNTVNVYDGTTVLATYTLASFGDLSAYDGNPYNHLDTAEPFFYLNLAAGAGEEITSVEFLNNTSSGFEIDNMSVNAPTPTPAPDGGMTASLLGMALVGMSIIRRKLAK
jgi:hypothetical protein